MPRTTEPSTIILHGDDGSRDRRDGVAQGPIEPGMLVGVTGTQDTGVDNTREVDAQAEDGVPVPFRLALEYSHTGLGIEDTYEEDQHLEYRHFKAGEVGYGWLADGETVAEDDLLVSAGDGTFRAAAGDGSEDAAAIGVATEAVDNDGGTEPERLRVEAI